MTLRVLRVAHRWVGLVLALPMLLQAVTGCVLVATPVWQAMRPVPAVSEGLPRPASAVLAAAGLPGLAPGLVPVRYQPGDGQAAAEIDMAAPGQRGAQLQVLVDPVSLAVLATRDTSQAYRWVHNLHENLLLPTMPGRSIVGWFGVGLLLLGLSGVVLWWPEAARPNRWRAAVTIRTSARGARLQRELHGAAGFWVSVMLVVISLSGTTLAFPQTIRAALGLPGGGGGPPGRGETRERAEPLDIDAVVARLSDALPGARVMEMRLPNPPGRPVFARLERPEAWQGAPPVIATIDPAGRRVLSLQDPQTQPLAMVSLGWLRGLHFGDAFGLPWRALVFLTGAALPVLSVTGVTLWLLRRRNRLRLQAQRRGALAAE